MCLTRLLWRCTRSQYAHLRFSKLRYFELRAPKISSCYTNYYKNRLSMTAYFYILIITHLLTIGVSGVVNACSVSPTQFVVMREAGRPNPIR